MIHGVFGKLGAGKGLLVMDIIAKELLEGYRDIVTNVPLRFMPWVNGQGIPQIGLKQYLIEKMGASVSVEEIELMLLKVKVIEDIDQGHDLFMNRRDGDTGEWFKLSVSTVDEKGKPARFDATEVKKRHCLPILCVTDEAWAFYPNNGGWSRVPLLTFYSKQQRKLRDEWYIVTQHPTDCDNVLWNIAQDFWVCRNHGMERMGIFRQPAMFRVIVYLSNPSKGNAIRSHEFYKVLDKKLSQCYDTTAGVGISGGHAGDSGQKRKGLHIAWLGVAVLVFVVALASVPHFIGHATGKWIAKTTAMPASAQAWALQSKSIHPLPSDASDGKLSYTYDNTNTLTCVGYTRVGNDWLVFLSDGRTFSALAGEVDYIHKREVKLLGVVYPVVARQPAPVEPLPVAPPAPPVVASVEAASVVPPASTMVVIGEPRPIPMPPLIRPASGVSPSGNHF